MAGRDWSFRCVAQQVSLSRWRNRGVNIPKGKAEEIGACLQTSTSSSCRGREDETVVERNVGRQKEAGLGKKRFREQKTR